MLFKEVFDFWVAVWGFGGKGLIMMFSCWHVCWVFCSDLGHQPATLELFLLALARMRPACTHHKVPNVALMLWITLRKCASSSFGFAVAKFACQNPSKATYSCSYHASEEGQQLKTDYKKKTVPNHLKLKQQPQNCQPKTNQTPT